MYFYLPHVNHNITTDVYLFVSLSVTAQTQKLLNIFCFLFFFKLSTSIRSRVDYILAQAG